MTPSALETLRAANPWPPLLRADGSPVRAWDYTLGGHGRHLIDALIDALPTNPVMVEIGCFLCASSRRWLTRRPDLTVIGIDPWDDSLIAQCQRYVGRPALTRAYPDRATQERFAADVANNGPFATALANVAEFGGRFIPLRDISPDALERVAAAGITPDLIYIDANKKSEDLTSSHQLWPQARLAGDDWHWGRTKGYPMRKIVESFAADKGFTIRAHHATWVLDPL